MCGVIGYAAPTAPISREALERGRDAMRARGPDGAGAWYTEGEGWSVGLGHRRLAIRDLSEAGHQPMLSPCGRYALSYNGELYEEERLRRRLSAYSVQLRGHSDTELLLYLLMHEGVSALEHLNGVFAFAFWDSERAELLLARDRFGVKPLYLCELRGGGAEAGLAFSSEVKGLLHAGLTPFQLNLQAHADLLALTYTPGEQSAIEGVEQLPPGSWLTWRASQGSAPAQKMLKRYWRPQLHEREGERLTLDDVAAWLRADLTRAVSERLVADVPVGIFLSGGLDSTGLVYAAHQAGRQDINTFTVRFEEAGYDESGFARRVADHFKTRHHEELVRPKPEEVFHELMEALDEPFADSSAIPLWYLCKSARERVTVVLGGDGGDELLAGYSTHVAGQLARLYRRLPTPLSSLAQRAAASLPVGHGKVSLDLKLKQFTRAASRDPAEAHFRFKEFLDEALRLELLSPALSSQALELRSPARHFTPHFSSSSQSPSKQTLLQQTLTCDQSLYLPNNILVKGDRVSMGASLELRVPYLDVHLAERLNSLPDDFKLRRLQGKWALKRALLGAVPHEVLWRKKQGFNVPMAQWLKGSLKPLREELLSEAQLKRVGLWSPSLVRQLIREHDAHVQDHSRPLWVLMCAVAYLKRYEPSVSAGLA